LQGEPLSPPELRNPAARLAGQHKSSADAPAGHKRRQEPGRELNGGSIIAGCDDFIDDSTLVLEVLWGGDVQVENKSVHVENVK